MTLAMMCQTHWLWSRKCQPRRSQVSDHNVTFISTCMTGPGRRFLFVSMPSGCVPDASMDA